VASKLALFNEALRHLGERKLATLTDNIEPRRVLDDIYDAAIIKRCLEAGQWDFATRSVSLTYNPSITPSFGLQYAFDKPTDYVRLCAISESAYLEPTLHRYREEGGVWLADIDTIYVAYVSTDSQYGGDLSLWPESFVQLVAIAMALAAAPRLTQSEAKVERLEKAFKKARSEAASKDAMNSAAKTVPAGAWVSARLGGRSFSRSREQG
jgi:hypothetical protein